MADQTVEQRNKQSEEREKRRKKLYEANFKNEIEICQPFKGTIGKQSTLLTNWYPLYFEGRKIHRYEVKIEVKDVKLIDLPEIFWQFFEKYQFEIFKCGYDQLSYDDRENFFTIRKIFFESDSYNFQYNGAYGSYPAKITLRYISPVDFPSTKQLKAKDATFNPIHRFIVQNVITQFRRMPEFWQNDLSKYAQDSSMWVANRNQLIRTQFNYGLCPQDEDLFFKLYGNNSTLVRSHARNITYQPLEVMNSLYGIYKGIHSEIKFDANGQPNINIALLTKLLANFELPLIQYYAIMVLGTDISEETFEEMENRNVAFSPSQLEKFTQTLKGLQFKTVYVTPMHYKFKGFCGGNAITTYIKDEPNRQISVQQYYQNKFGLALRFPHMQLLKVDKSPIPIPVELCRLSLRAQNAPREFSEKVRNMICRFATHDPVSYFDKVSEMGKMAIFDPVHNLHLKSFGIQLAGNPDFGDLKPMQINCHILPKPMCPYTDNNPLQKPALEVTQKKIFLIACTVNSHNISVDKDNLIRQLVDEMRVKGQNVENADNLECTDEEFNKIEDVRTFIRAHKNKYDLKKFGVVFVFFIHFKEESDSPKNSIKTDQIYGWIKLCGDKYEGVPTQCINAINFRDLRKNTSKLRSGLQGVASKIIIKLGGVINAISENSKSDCNRIFSEYTSESYPTLFLGIFVVKEKNSVKIALSFNVNREATKFNHICAFAKNDRGDAISNIHQSFIEVLMRFRENIGCFPSYIFMFRGGLSESLNEIISEYEVEKMEYAYNQIKGKEASVLPRIVYLVVDRSHKSRFMRLNKTGTKIRDRNMKRGTVIDSEIVSPKGNEFILCSHRTLQGTVCPTRYTVCQNEFNIYPDDLQLMVYTHCFLVQRSIYSTALPAPLYYAHLMSDRLSIYGIPQKELMKLKIHPDIMRTNYVT